MQFNFKQSFIRFIPFFSIHIHVSNTIYVVNKHITRRKIKKIITYLETSLDISKELELLLSFKYLDSSWPKTTKIIKVNKQ